jgi:hypothetical protein
MRASYKPRAVAVQTGKGSTIVRLSPGQFIFGRDSAAYSLKEPPSTIRNRMKKLKDIGMIDVSADSQYSVITICNWEQYQAEDLRKGQLEDSQRTTEGQLKDTDKKDKKDKKVKNSLGRTSAPQEFPVTEEMRIWVQANTSFHGNIESETEKFLDYFRGKGDLRADWHATWRNWMRKAGEYSYKGEVPPKATGNGFAGSGKRLIT